MGQEEAKLPDIGLIEHDNVKCVECGCVLPDKDSLVTQYAINNKRVCQKHHNEISQWLNKGWTYQEWDEVGARKYPRIFTEENQYKKLGKY